MANDLQTEQRERSVALASYLSTKREEFEKISDIDPDKFLRIVNNAILRDPEISQATSQSIFIECQKAAQDGLVLDGREAVLTRFKTNKKKKIDGRWIDNWQTEVVYIPMLTGIMKRVRNSGEIKSWSVAIVYENEYAQDRFSYIAAPTPEIRHEPILFGDRGKPIAAYSAVQLRDNTMHYEVMTIEEINNIMNRTKSKRKKTINNVEVEEITGPWATDFLEMAKKTVIRRHSKRLPVSSENLAVTMRVDNLYDFKDQPEDITDIEPAQQPPKKKESAAAKMRRMAQERAAEEQQASQQEDADNDDEGQPEGGSGDNDGDSNIIEGEILNDDNQPEGESQTGEIETSNKQPKDEF